MLITNMIFYYDTKLYCVSLDSSTKIGELYDIISEKSGKVINSSNVCYYNGKELDDIKTLDDYGIIHDSTIYIRFSLRKHSLSRPPDVLGHTIFNDFIDWLGRRSKPTDFNIFSLMGFNVDSTSYKKNITQQLQPDLLKSLLVANRSVLELQDEININIIIPDYNFIEYNEAIITTVIEQTTQLQIHNYLSIESDMDFSQYFPQFQNRIVKYQTRLVDNPDLQTLLDLSYEYDSELIDKIKISFYYVGIKFMDQSIRRSRDVLVINGIDLSKIKHTNLYVNLWMTESVYPIFGHDLRTVFHYDFF